MKTSPIKVAIIGIGNCASALVQGLSVYRRAGRSDGDTIGLMHWSLGGYTPEDIEVVAAYDIDKRKVGRDVSEAIFSAPNCARRFAEEVPATAVDVRMGAVLDGVSTHMEAYPEDRRFLIAGAEQPTRKDVVAHLREVGAQVMLNYLPVGSEEATAFYAECALEAGVAFVNNIPVFIASDPEWAARFRDRRVPIIGDDIKSQVGATIVHRVLTDLFRERGVELDRTYQLNTGGNTDFLNMLNRQRLSSKKTSKTEAVRSVAGNRLDDENIHIGPSDYVPWQKDNKLAFIRMEGRIFGGVPLELELRLSVQDSPNSAGVAIDSVRCARLALDRGIGGPLEGPSAYFCKHPPRQFPDDEARDLVDAFIQGGVESIRCRA